VLVSPQGARKAIVDEGEKKKKNVLQRGEWRQAVKKRFIFGGGGSAPKPSSDREVPPGEEHAYAENAATMKWLMKKVKSREEISWECE